MANTSPRQLTILTEGVTNFRDQHRCWVSVCLAVSACVCLGWAAWYQSISGGLSNTNSDFVPGPRFADALSASAPVGHAGFCFKATGGTCMTKGCNANRGPTTCSSFPWFECLCVNGTCADLRGDCVPLEHGLQPVRWNTYLRYNVEWFAMMAPVATALRSGASTALGYVVAVGFSTQAERPTSSFAFDSSWEEGMRRNKFTGPVAAVGQSIIKLGCFHLPQPVGFLCSYFAFQNAIGIWQWFFATMVALRQVLYLLVIVVGIVVAPNFLLFRPGSDSDTTAKIVYCLAPEIFINKCIDYRVNSVWSNRLAQVFNLYLFPMGDIGAICATAFGLMNDKGDMWPGLLVGYALSFMSLLVFIYLLCKFGCPH